MATRALLEKSTVQPLNVWCGQTTKDLHYFQDTPRCNGWPPWRHQYMREGQWRLGQTWDRWPWHSALQTMCHPSDTSGETHAWKHTPVNIQSAPATHIFSALLQMVPTASEIKVPLQSNATWCKPICLFASQYQRSKLNRRKKESSKLVHH